MAFFLLRVYGLVLWLITSLIGYTKVLYVSAKVLELKLSTAVMDSEVDDDMVVSSAMLLSNHVIKSIQCFVAVLNRHFNNLVMFQLKLLLWRFRVLSLLTE